MAVADIEDRIAHAQRHRSSIFLEDAELVSVEKFPAEQFIMRLRAPRCAERASPGSFVHIQCSEQIPMRRPLSIMRASKNDGWIEVLFKSLGEGLRALGSAEIGDVFSIIGPIGKGFVPDQQRPNTVLIGGGVGIPPMVFLAESMQSEDFDWNPIVLMGSEIPFPFDAAESKIPCDWLNADINHTMPLLDRWNVPARLASLAGFDGCFNGYVTDLSKMYLESLTEEQRQQTELYACGPTIMLQAVAKLAEGYSIPAQVSLEEYMACAVGGCAGCTVEIQSDDGPTMQRVCVDGPVFEASRVVF